jgi:hypothetical protein
MKQGEMMAKSEAFDGFDLVCPKCGQEGAIDLDLNNLHQATCGECSEEFDPAEVAEELTAAAQKWAAVARWIEAAQTFAAPTP